MLSTRVPLRSLKAFLYAICITTAILFIFADPVLANPQDAPPAADPTSDTSVSTTTVDPNVSVPSPSATIIASPATTTTTTTIDNGATTTTTSSGIQLPTVMYVPPVSPSANMNAIDPFFPTGSESCQQCKYFYPKLKECNQIANTTLAKLAPVPGNDTVAPTTTATAIATSALPRMYAPAEFTTILPFLQCICPNQGLPAIKVCMTCFRVSNQRNFLDVIEAQNVSSSLSSFQEACMDSDDGSHVPPPARKGQSASGLGSNHAIGRPERYSIHVTIGLGLLLIGITIFLGGCTIL